MKKKDDQTVWTFKTKSKYEFLLYMKAIFIFFLLFNSCQDAQDNEKTEGNTSSTTIQSETSTDKYAPAYNGAEHIYQDLIKDFNAAEIIMPIEDIKITADDTRQLGEGWSHLSSSNNFRWAEGLESVVFFNYLGSSDIRMKIDCRPFAPSKSHQQAIKILLNGYEINKIFLKKKQSVYFVMLPANHLKKGKNQIRFQYNYAEKPSNFKNSNDNRKLAVAFKEISLDSKEEFQKDDFFIKKVENTILQSPGGMLNYYYYIPTGCNLEIKIDKIKNSTLVELKIESNNGNSLQTEFTPPQSKIISLKKFSDSFVKFSFYVKRKNKSESSSAESDQALVSWEKIFLKRKSDNETETFGKTHVKLEKFRRQIKQLDIIYIVFDAFSAKHSSLYGYHRETTPFLEELGNNNIVFDNFYANHPYTSASTGTLLTSKYSYEHSLITRENKLNPDYQTIPEILSSNGIESFLITGHSFLKGHWGLPRGFTKVFFDDYKNNIKKITEVLKKIYNSPRRKKQKFIYLHLLPPHLPYDPPEKYRIFTKSNQKKISMDARTFTEIEKGTIKITKNHLDYIVGMYDAYVLYADHIAKTIMTFLKRNGILKKSIVIITSDHGEAFMEHGMTRHSTTVYEEMVHTPFIMIIPEHINGAKNRIAHLASVVDVAPTVMDVFGINPATVYNGHSILPLIFGIEANKDDHIYMETLVTGHRAIRGPKYKLISTPSGNELYDLINDPEENVNLLGEKPFWSGYYMFRLGLYRQGSTETNILKKQVDIDDLEPETVQQLKELGYIQ